MNIFQDNLRQLSEKITDLQKFNIDNTWTPHKVHLHANFTSNTVKYHSGVMEFIKWDYMGGPGPM